MTSLLPPIATPLEQALEDVLRPAFSMNVTISQPWDIAACPVDQLPWLAWALSVDRWDAEWSADIKRDTIRNAVEVHRLKGTRAGLRLALSPLGFDLDISEWFEHGGDPHTFRVDAFADGIFEAGGSLNAELYADVQGIVDDVKPARTHYDLRIGERFTAGIHTRTATRPAVQNRQSLDPVPATHAVTIPLSLRNIARITDHTPVSARPAPRALGGQSAASLRAGMRIVTRHSANTTVTPRSAA